MKLKFIDLFSGAGGLSCGLEMAGHKCLLGVDHDKYSMQTFALNHKHAKTFHGPIEKLTNKAISEFINNEKVDIVVGGPPCQGFSTVGKGDPNDLRNSLFKEYVRIIKHLSPEFLIMENVTGLLAKKNEKVFNRMVKDFLGLGYNLNVKVLEAWDFGVPQRRRRTIFLAGKINTEIEFPKPHYKDNENKVTLGDIIEDLKAQDGVIYNHQEIEYALNDKIKSQRLKHIPEGASVRYQKDQELYWPKKIWYEHDWSSLKENRLRQAQYYRIHRAKPSPTIMTSGSSYFHPYKNRNLTVRECAKIQSFPNDFIFAGSRTSQFRQVGNAVPPLLGKHLGEQIVRLIKKEQKYSPEKTQKKVKIKSLEETIRLIRSNAFIY